MRSFYCISLLLLSLPTLSQTPEKDYYAGLEVGYNAYRSGFGWVRQGFAPALTLGAVLKPGVTAQLGLSTFQSRSEHRESWVDRASYPRPFPINAYYQTRVRTLILPALLRLDLGRSAQQPRLQVQALAGVTAMVHMQYGKTTLADSTYAVYSYQTDRQTSI